VTCILTGNISGEATDPLGNSRLEATRHIARLHAPMPLATPIRNSVDIVDDRTSGRLVAGEVTQQGPDHVIDAELTLGELAALRVAQAVLANAPTRPRRTKDTTLCVQLKQRHSLARGFANPFLYCRAVCKDTAHHSAIRIAGYP